MQQRKRCWTLSSRDVLHAAAMAIACFIAYWITVDGLAPFVGRDDDLWGGMWATVATIFVFRETRADTLFAGFARLFATTVSFALCLVYLLIFPFTPIGMAALLGAGTIIVMLLGRREDIITTAITTAVVMVVAVISSGPAWHQPLLRLVDTVVGIGVGVSLRWIFCSVLCRLVEGRVQ